MSLRTITFRSLRLANPSLLACRSTIPSAVLGIRRIQTISTRVTTADEEQSILVEQRKNRPTSPHLDIYQPQLTWILSGVHRLTGVILGFTFFGITCTYAASSILGLGIDTAAIAATIGTLPVLVKGGLKVVYSFPFAYHAFNGVRHLVWDYTKELTVKGVYRTGYLMLGATAIGGSILAFFY